MHAKSDNPELIKARELGIKIMSFPEYLYEQTKDKKRIVVAGSHGIAWDHMNVFPTFENYIAQFKIFTEKISDGGSLIYFDGDAEVKKIAMASGNNIRKIPYKVHGYFQNKTGFYAATHSRVVPVKIFGEHNMQNLSAAREACIAAGVPEERS
jgi:UDP-N-acetylmuramate: L-alanyl-gamma-D-glutamyl-meso-diaminopimelate ligase